MYKISAQCIQDVEFKAEIVNNASLSGCDVTGDLVAVSVDIDEYEDFFRSLFELFDLDPNGESAVHIIQSRYSFFTHEEYGNQILDYFASKGIAKYASVDKVAFLPDIQERMNVWEEIKKKVKFQSRYLVDLDDYELEKLVDIDTSLAPGTRLYRARIVPEGHKYLQKDAMGVPPTQKAIAGRANPIGIPYLYLCKDVDTTYYEVRAALQDRISVGSFITVRELSIVSFDSNISLYEEYASSGNLVDGIVRKRVLESIRVDLSKPLRRYDTELDYVPTQFICEYCRIKLHADGVTFESSLHPGGQNYVLFSSDAVICQLVKTHTVDQIVIKAT